MKNQELTEGQSRDTKRESRGSRAQRWDAFINELKAYIEEHHLGPTKHTTLRNQVVYFRRKMRDGLLPEDKAEELERVLSMRDLSIHTGGRKPKASPSVDEKACPSTSLRNR